MIAVNTNISADANVLYGAASHHLAIMLYTKLDVILGIVGKVRQKQPELIINLVNAGLTGYKYVDRVIQKSVKFIYHFILNEHN